MIIEGVNPHVLVDEAGEEVDGVARGLLHDVDVADHGGPLARHQVAVFLASDAPDLQVVVISDGEAIGLRPATTMAMATTATPAWRYCSRLIHCWRMKPMPPPPTNLCRPTQIIRSLTLALAKSSVATTMAMAIICTLASRYLSRFRFCCTRKPMPPPPPKPMMVDMRTLMSQR